MSDDNQDDAARKAVLARRARFVAAALAGISVACGKSTKPQPCLEIPPTGSEAPPGPCLSVPWQQPDAGAPSGTDGGSATEGPALTPDGGGKTDGGGAPQPCLKIAPTREKMLAPPPPPQPCLSPKPPAK